MVECAGKTALLKAMLNNSDRNDNDGHAAQTVRPQSLSSSQLDTLIKVTLHTATKVPSSTHKLFESNP